MFNDSWALCLCRFAICFSFVVCICHARRERSLYKYLNFITEKHREVTPLREKEKTASDDEKKHIQEKILNIDTEVKNFKHQFESNYSDIFFTKILKATTDPVIPNAPDTMDKQEKQIFQFMQDLTNH